ncbi:MAG: cellulose binding domain-containing protein [Deltaproteobacteria bacterium]
MKTRLPVAFLAAALLLAAPSAWAATSSAPVPRAIVSADSAWGTATDSWAGYTGALKIWVPQAVRGGWTLTFQSAELGRQVEASSFWNGSASYDASTHTFTVRSPSWAGDVAANAVLAIGFAGSGVLGQGFALSGCTFNGQPCVASVMTSADSQQTLASLQAGTTGGSAGTTGPTGPTGSTGTTGTTGTIALQVVLSVDTSWQTGFGGTVAVKNASGAALPAGASGWQVRLRFPDAATARDVFQGGPWNFQVAFGADGTATLSPMSWASPLAPAATTSSGFNGGSTANLAKATSADPSVTVSFSGTGGSVTPPAPPSPPTPPPPVDGSGGLPTGAVVGGFLFGPYKDAGISMNWNTSLMSTAATGSLQPLIHVLPARVPSVTWAFATGECGKENWAGIAPDALAAANVPAFVAADVDYVISTGGAAGAFTCSTASGMRTFINRYASKNLVGVDFDIEAGQSAAAIDTLVAQVAAVQADYPNLRFSFTIATLGSSNGGALNTPYGDLSVTGYNVVQSLVKHPIANYTVNLMVMDYGSASAGVCVVKSGRCDMGQTAIQAALNLESRFGIPYERIELTPMIGVNDVTDETFSLADVDTMSAFVLANHLAGVHFWSLDRDTPCAQAYASPVCSSVATVPTWGYANRFVQALGL